MRFIVYPASSRRFGALLIEDAAKGIVVGSFCSWVLLRLIYFSNWPKRWQDALRTRNYDRSQSWRLRMSDQTREPNSGCGAAFRTVSLQRMTKKASNGGALSSKPIWREMCPLSDPEFQPRLSVDIGRCWLTIR